MSRSLFMYHLFLSIYLVKVSTFHSLMLHWPSSGAMQWNICGNKNGSSLRSRPVREMRVDNWQEAARGYITAPAGGSAPLPPLLKVIPLQLSLSNLPTILSFLLTVFLSSQPASLVSLTPESAKRVKREERGTTTNMVKIRWRHFSGVKLCGAS